MRTRKLLLDTNVLIPLEDDTGYLPKQLVAVASQHGHSVFRHPETRFDLARDSDRERAHRTRTRLAKYPALPNPPPVVPRLLAQFGDPVAGSNDHVDIALLSAVLGNAVDILVTEDRGVHSKARRLRVHEQVLHVADAIAMIRTLSGEPAPPPPAVRASKAHEIRDNDPILDGFRADYPKFDDWFAKAKREHRIAWLVGDNDERLDAIAIVKEEDPTDWPEPGQGRTLKLCSFKVADHARGRRLGELLLRTVLDYNFDQGYSRCVVTVFEKHAHLLRLFEDFGFEAHEERTPLGELKLSKPCAPIHGGEGLIGVDYAIRFGPRHFDPDQEWYVVPIQRRFANVLFPDTAILPQLGVGRDPFGNAVRKAYLCHAAKRAIPPGSILLFYHSGKVGGISLGVVEYTFRTRSVDEVVKNVGHRTVYSLEQIEQLCQRDVLAILFRLARSFSPPLSPRELAASSVLKGAPQSIAKIPRKGVRWLRKRLDV